MSSDDSTTAVEAVFRIEFPRLVGGLTRYVGDVGLAEELAQDTLVEAIVQWPRDGTPRNPGAWLMAVGKRKAIDRFRRDRMLYAKYEQLGRLQVVHDLTDGQVGSEEFEDHISDDVLRLMFVACHPIVPMAGRVALTLRLVGGLTTSEIARAYVLSEPTIAQRIVRAKKSIARAGVPFEVPSGPERAARLGSVLEVVYLIFNEGYAATSGENWVRPELCAEALRLGRILVGLAPRDPEAHGLLALMELQSSRLQARLGPSGQPVLLLDQDRHRWDRLSIHRGLAALGRAEELGGSTGPYALQAAIAACHAVAFSAEETDWAKLAELYAVLARQMPSPIVELNRAVAVAMATGPETGLAIVDQLVATHTLDRYHQVHSVRGDLLEKMGRHDEAVEEFTTTARLTANASEQGLALDRAEINRQRAAAQASSGRRPD